MDNENIFKVDVFEKIGRLIFFIICKKYKYLLIIIWFNIILVFIMSKYMVII